MTDITKFNSNNIIYNIGDEKSRQNFSDAFSITTSYSTGDLVIYDGSLYKFIQDHEAGDWNLQDVEQTNIKNELFSCKPSSLTFPMFENSEDSCLSWALSLPKSTFAIAYFTSVTQDKPVDGIGGPVMVLRAGNQGHTRIIFFKTASELIYTNSYNGNNNVWKGWKQISTATIT